MGQVPPPDRKPLSEDGRYRRCAVRLATRKRRARSSAGNQTLKNRILIENYYLPADLKAKIDAFVDTVERAAGKRPQSSSTCRTARFAGGPITSVSAPPAKPIATRLCGCAGGPEGQR
jgi:hypothetical protein